VHEQDIALAALADLERLAGADGNNIDIDAARLPELRYEVAQQAGLLRRRGRGDGDERIILRARRRPCGREKQRT
jgi:hypothetical protein